jgi:hypothetical protein
MPFDRNAWKREWRRRHQEHEREQRKGWAGYKYAAGRATREAHAANMRVLTAIKRGRLTRPTKCPRCEAETFIEAAHLNYTERFAFIWLCRPCHRAWDRAYPKGGYVRKEAIQ